MASAALRDALGALARWRDANYAHACWIADGAPRLTEAGHVARFGTTYTKQTRKRGKA